jgi:thymidylate synthase
MMSAFRNVNGAFVGMLDRVLTEGVKTESRVGPTIELISQTIVIEQPLERFVFAPGRNGNPFAAIAESLWVLAGRSDLAYLTPYLKRAPDFSDDGGRTWRAGYGPRLRSWHGTDQLAAVRNLLHDSPTSRRAVASLFDPSEDFQVSNDVPCNNWLHFLARDGHLDLNVAARSTDIWWGFSGINAFEWSVALEMMARWLGLQPGVLTFFTSSLHLYERHYDQARTVLSRAESDSPYVGQSRMRYDTAWEDASGALAQWMDLEESLRTGTDLDALALPFGDPLLMGYLRAIDVFWSFKRRAAPAKLEQRLDLLGDSDVGAVAREFINRPNARDH